MATTKKLEIEFSCNNGKNKTYSINNPKSNLSLATCEAFVDEITSNSVMDDEYGAAIGLLKARYIETTVTDITA